METSNRSADEYIDDALITDSVKKLLSSDNPDAHHFDLTSDLLSNASNASQAVNCGQMAGHSAPTVQEGMDLVDALDTLVQHLSRESNNVGKQVADSQLMDTNQVLTPFDIVLQDHNYCHTYDYYVSPSIAIGAQHIQTSNAVNDQTVSKDVTQSFPPSSQKPITTNTTPVSSSAALQSSSFMSFNDNSYASSSTMSATSPAPRTPGSPPTTPSNKSSPKTPQASRRSQRQIDRIEKSVLEKIKAENQEMLKREKESMESPNKLRQTSESMDDNNKDMDENELVIDFDKKKEKPNQSNNKKRMKKPKSQTNEPTNKKSRIDCKQQSIDKTMSAKAEEESTTVVKQETSELDDVIAALSGVTDADDQTPASVRQQRTRRKPKRWDDDEVEVDFSGQLGILAEQQKQKLENCENVELTDDKDKDSIKSNSLKNNKIISNDDKNANKSNDSQLSSNDEDDEEMGSDFGSEDDPDKLWCICRQPHDDRFMIGCDSCEEWFHGKCVNVTKQQGRTMEKAGQEWLCTTCTKGISEGVSRDELKKTADQKRHKLEAEERIRAQTKRAAREKFLKREKIGRDLTKKRERRDSENSKKAAQKPPPPETTPKPPLLPKKVSQMPPKKRELHLRLETEESEKLKKLIKSSKKDLNKKRELLVKKFNKVVNEGPKELSDSRSPELQPISKVVPIVRKPEVKKKHKDAIDPSVQDLFKAEPMKKTSTTTPPTTPNTPGSTPFSRKSSVDSRRLSTSSSVERQCPSGCGKTVKSEQTVYCNQECIETHVNETLKLLRSIRKEKYDSGVKIKEIDRRVVVVEKTSGRILSGKDGIPEKEVLEYIKSNPTFELFRPSSIKDKKREDLNVKTPIPPKSPKKEEKRPSISRSNSRGGDGDGTDPIRANVRTALKDTLQTRCKEADETAVKTEDILKTANRIEEELFKLFNKDTSGKYRNKYRSLIFNLKDTKNQGLFRKVVNGKISPERLVQMSAEELASSELAKWREREKISMLEMIKRDAADKVNQVIVKKTHKGEELIESNIINETTNEQILDEGKSCAPTSTPSSSVSTILDDLMGPSTIDTTSQHKTHLFSNNCRICTNKQTDDTKQEVAKKSSTREEHSRPTPKRVRVDSDSANKILLEAAKLSSSVKILNSAEDEDSPELPTSTVSLSSPEAPSSSSASRPIWKGNVFMQDVAKFAANAVKVSGTVAEYLSQDISNQITVCGRIAPEQVLDYVKKLKYSSRSEIGLIKLISPKEERIGYDAFFDYLNSRGRYGVVGTSSKWIKDFYILPLPKNKDIPDVLLPFDGPGLDKKSLRPNLLLGIIIRNKKHVGSQAPQTSTSNTSQNKSKTANSSEFRSYTPPPKTPSNESSPEDNKDLDDVSYTPPHMTSTTSKPKITTKSTADDDEPYDPEEADLSNSNSLPTSSSHSIPELMEQIAKSSNPVEMTSSVLSAIASSSNLELQRRLLEQLTAKVDEQKRQLEEQKAEAEANASKNSSNASSTVIPGLDGQFASLKDIKIPDNLQDILSTVKQKTKEIEQQQERLRAVAAAGFKFDDPIVKNFATKVVGKGKESIESTPEGEPMEVDEEVSPTKTSIIEVNTPVPNNTAKETSETVTDPRLRSNKQRPLPSITEEAGAHTQVAAMTPDELMMKARQQMAALAQMEANTNSSGSNQTKKTNNNNNNNNNSQKIKFEWKKKK